MKKYLICDGKNAYGPYDKAHIAGFLKQGYFLTDSKFYDEDLNKWLPMEELLSPKVELWKAKIVNLSVAFGIAGLVAMLTFLATFIAARLYPSVNEIVNNSNLLGWLPTINSFASFIFGYANRPPNDKRDNPAPAVAPTPNDQDYKELQKAYDQLTGVHLALSFCSSPKATRFCDQN